LIKMKQRGEKIAMLTAYDFPTARRLDEAGAEVLLVGDSLGMVVLGYESTLPVTVDEMIHHTKAVVRGTRRAMVMADMPYLSYHVTLRESVRNAGRFIQEAGAKGVKLEGGRKRARVVKAIREAEIPVMGHVGLTPQSVHDMGGFKVQGRSAPMARAILEDALALEDAGVFALVLEGIPCELAEILTRRLSIPTLGIGAGPACDGQVLVTHDILGLTEGPKPTFVREYAHLGEETLATGRRFIEEVRAGTFPGEAESTHLKPEVLEALRGSLEVGLQRTWKA
jgi:3-methyl-2-oxobutanoate hydroxymethyltransferase